MLNTLSFFEQLSLPASERRVANWVAQAPSDAIALTMAELAQAAGVSQPTIARFCQSAGFDGYKEFRLWLAQTVGSQQVFSGGTPYVDADVKARDTVDQVLQKISHRTQLAVAQLQNLIDPKQIKIAVDLLFKARRIEFYGMGNSGITAQDGAHKFFRLGKTSIAYSDPNIHSVAACMLSELDVLVAISNSGRTRELLQSVVIAQEAGAQVIAITAPSSPLAKIAQVVLPVEPTEDPDLYAPMTTRIAHLVLIDALAVSVTLKMGPATQTVLQSYKAVLNRKQVKTRY
jgi:RpiR family transcriptional regulator, carbohydrate utilization regulator